jgi:histidinol-phosphate phosphatase family protein
MRTLRQAVLLCGGLGTRLRPHTDTLPKPMIPVNGRPFLEFLIEQLREQGIAQILLLTGYRGQQIEDHFGDGSRFGVAITYSRGPAEWETGRRLIEAHDQLEPRFLLLYGDNFVLFSLAKLLTFGDKWARPATLMLSAKPSGNIEVDADGIVRRYDASRSSTGLNHVEIGYMLVERDQVLALIDPPDISFSRVLEHLAARNGLAGLVNGDRYHSISDPKRWRLAEQYLQLKRILLVDRDGTLNIRPARAQYLTRWEDFHWAPGALEGLEVLAGAGFIFALISNQAGIGRGLLTQEQVETVNSRMVEYLVRRGITMIRTYVCPHHWNAGCACRKPAPGLFFQASREMLLRLDRTLFLGDDPRDCQAAANAGCPSVFIGNEEVLVGLETEARPAHIARTIAEAVPWIRTRFDTWEMWPAVQHLITR